MGLGLLSFCIVIHFYKTNGSLCAEIILAAIPTSLLCKWKLFHARVEGANFEGFQGSPWAFRGLGRELRMPSSVWKIGALDLAPPCAVLIFILGRVLFLAI